MFIKFKTDDSIDKKGFSAEYKSVSQAEHDSVFYSESVFVTPA